MVKTDYKYKSIILIFFELLFIGFYNQIFRKAYLYFLIYYTKTPVRIFILTGVLFF